MIGSPTAFCLQAIFTAKASMFKHTNLPCFSSYSKNCSSKAPTSLASIPVNGPGRIIKNRAANYSSTKTDPTGRDPTLCSQILTGISLIEKIRYFSCPKDG